MGSHLRLAANDGGSRFRPNFRDQEFQVGLQSVQLARCQACTHPVGQRLVVDSWQLLVNSRASTLDSTIKLHAVLAHKICMHMPPRTCTRMTDTLKCTWTTFSQHTPRSSRGILRRSRHSPPNVVVPEAETSHTRVHSRLISDLNYSLPLKDP